ncbi:MAG TPA: DUF4149 domain-containing protein [Terriglobales bacterium]
MLLAMVVWIGGIIFFAFVVAPTLFTVLSSPQMAGGVIGPTLNKLHFMGLVSGVVFLICSLLLNRRQYAQLRVLTATHFLIVLMLALTAVSEFVITPRIRELRTRPLSMDTVSAGEQFKRLHAWSTRLEGSVLLLGLGVVVLNARRWGEGSR